MPLVGTMLVAVMLRMDMPMPWRRCMVMVVVIVRTRPVGRIHRVAAAHAYRVAAVSAVTTIAAIAIEVIVTAVMSATREQQGGKDKDERLHDLSFRKRD